MADVRLEVRGRRHPLRARRPQTRRPLRPESLDYSEAWDWPSVASAGPVDVPQLRPIAAPMTPASILSEWEKSNREITLDGRLNKN